MTRVGTGPRILVVGAGGLGSAASIVLARSLKELHLTIVDDDSVDESNLHRQLLYTAADVGAPKLERAAEHLRGLGASVQTISTRLIPDNAIELIGKHDLVVEGADNFATKFLSLDAAMIAGVPLVQAGAVRWSGWAFATSRSRHAGAASACMRCVFEDIPRGPLETCADAGVVGPVVGLLGAISAALAIRILRGDSTAAGELWRYEALPAKIRATRIEARVGCPACAGDIRDVAWERYAPAP